MKKIKIYYFFLNQLHRIKDHPVIKKNKYHPVFPLKINSSWVQILILGDTTWICSTPAYLKYAFTSCLAVLK